MQIEGYSGICRGCFDPIKTGDERQYRENGLKFCSKCFEKDGYYQRLEKRRLSRKKVAKNAG